jgi:hypothetical protein
MRNTLRLLGLLRDAQTADREHYTLVKASGLFDSDWYVTQYPDVQQTGKDPLQHYLEFGWKGGRSPSALFDTAWYLNAYQDVARSGEEPVLHFLRYGAREGRKINAAGVGLSGESRMLETDATEQPQQVVHPETTAASLMTPLALPEVTRAAVIEASDDQRGSNSLRSLLADTLIGFVADECKGRDVLEIGFRDVATLELAVACIARGATSFRILHHERPVDVTARLRRVAKRLRADRPVSIFLEGYVSNENGDTWRPYWTETSGRDWVIRSGLNERDIRNKLEQTDLVISLSSVFHADDILQLMRRLAFVSDDLVIFDTVIVEPFDVEVAGETISFRSSDVWYAGDMNLAQSQAMAIYWRERGVNLEQYQIFPDGIDKRLCLNRGVSGVWWWFIGREGLENLLALSNLERVKIRTMWGGRSVLVMARKAGTDKSATATRSSASL